jgi:hypothetical protein
LDAAFLCVQLDLIRISDLLKLANGRVNEVVEENVNGVIFDSADELYEALIVRPEIIVLTKKLLSDGQELDRLRAGVRDLRWRTWSEEWDKLAKPIFR